MIAPVDRGGEPLIMYSVICGSTSSGPRIFLVACESSPLWTGVNAMFADDKSAGGTYSLTLFCVQDDVVPATLWASELKAVPYCTVS